MHTISTNPVPTPRPSPLNPFSDQFAASEGTRRPFPLGDPKAARQAHDAKRAEWANLSLRQTWADEAFMRGHLRAAGVRINDNNEPATVPRLKSLLRRAGINGPEITASVGKDLAGFLTLNPRLPLWAAVALILEATGRFTAKAST